MFPTKTLYLSVAVALNSSASVAVNALQLQDVTATTANKNGLTESESKEPYLLVPLRDLKALEAENQALREAHDSDAFYDKRINEMPNFNMGFGRDSMLSPDSIASDMMHKFDNFDHNSKFGLNSESLSDSESTMSSMMSMNGPKKITLESILHQMGQKKVTDSDSEKNTVLKQFLKNNGGSINVMAKDGNQGAKLECVFKPNNRYSSENQNKKKTSKFLRSEETDSQDSDDDEIGLWTCKSMAAMHQHLESGGPKGENRNHGTKAVLDSDRGMIEDKPHSKVKQNNIVV